MTMGQEKEIGKENREEIELPTQAVLVMDMPERCEDCKLWAEDGRFNVLGIPSCGITEKNHNRMHR